ncbi:SMP-30/gluconolactonase/LRE family protein [Pseudactinotalea sp.]|uniref:SMP-30/gluconolactonase/LRE family protein n=1 Tax=Pseudactinotalea sp. TaxID=1926260 RepID=UPI003B3ACDE9
MNGWPSEAERVWSGAEWAEGPLWLAATRSVRISDIPNNRILDIDPATGGMTVVDDAAEYPNGRTGDHDGSILQCSHGRRAVERVAHGVTTTVVSTWGGGVRFNSPNDIVVAADGAIWFTDPPYGLHSSGREGHPGEQEYAGCYVFRYADGEAVPMITDMVHPNGLAFSRDFSLLYVADSGRTWHPEGPHHLRVFDLATGASEVFAEIDPGFPDGLRVDPDGLIWTSAGRQVRVYTPGGVLAHTIELPERVSNLCPYPGGWYVTAGRSLYRVVRSSSG